MAELLTPDLCVIGAGAGGLDAAAGAAAFGVPVVLVEKARMGGGWLNTGSVPSSAFIAAARHARGMTEAEAFGVTAQNTAIDFGKLREHIQSVRDAIAPNATKERFTGLGVRVIDGAARFKDRRTLAVGDATEIRARRFVIATGSLPALAPIAGLEAVPHLTEDTIFDLTKCPEHLIVIGAGATGLELAQAFHAFGAKVTVLDAGEPLASEDTECARILLGELARDGIVVRGRVAIARLERVQGRTRVVLAGADREETIEGSDLLLTGPRRPNVDGLGLDDARIKHGPEGIAVNKGLRTSNKRVYAIGDVIGAPRAVHAARHHAGLVVRNALFRQSVSADGSLIPRVIRTHPELAQVGLTDVAAARRARRICVLRWPFCEVDEAWAEREPRGHIKVVTDRKGRVVGATIIGPGAGELISIWSLAVGQGLNIAAIAGMVVPASALAEIGKRAAVTYLLSKVTSPWGRRIIGWLRSLG